MMVKNRYDDPTMKVAIWQKDMQVIGDFAKSLHCPTALFSITEPIYAAALRGGHAADDTASVCAVLEAKARVKRGKVGRKAAK
jgi:putative dehydrogenase